MSVLADRVDRVFSEWDKPDSPGCSLAVIQYGEIIYKRGYGMANLELDVPIRPDSIFDIGSTSKQFTALSVLLLSRRGVLSLDDPIQKYLPEIPGYGAPVTIRHLIHHTSGIRDYLTLMAIANMPFENDYQEDLVVDLVARQKALNFTPGDEHLYSNSGYFLLSEIVERASGQDLRQFAHENIFEPLGMRHTHYHNNFKEIVPQRASGYTPKKGGGFEIDMGIFDILGDGAVYTSVEDLFLWDQNFYHNVLDGGGQDLIDQMQTCGVLNNREKLEYAFGLLVSSYRGLKIVSHGGAWYGYRAQLLRFPEEGFSVICLANLGTISPDLLCKQVADIYLEDRLAPEEEAAAEAGEERPVSVPYDELMQKVGFYKNEENGSLCEVTAGEDGLSIEAMGETFTMQAVGATRFKAVNAPFPIYIQFDEDGGQIDVDIARGQVKGTFKKMESFQIPAEELLSYEGEYYSEELNTTYSLKAAEKTLEISPCNQYMETLKPAIKDLFNAGAVNLKFFRDQADRVAGFSINAGRVKDIRFIRK
jgi:CubicO group peptidase (beta-lactamase class C family)